MEENEQRLLEAIAYAIWKSPGRMNTSNLEDCRLIAPHVLAHLRRSHWAVVKTDTLEFGAACVATAPKEQ